MPSRWGANYQPMAKPPPPCPPELSSSSSSSGCWDIAKHWDPDGYRLLTAVYLSNAIGWASEHWPMRAKQKWLQREGERNKQRNIVTYCSHRGKARREENDFFEIITKIIWFLAIFPNILGAKTWLSSDRIKKIQKMDPP